VPVCKLLDVFQVSILHNFLYLTFGVAGLALARTAAKARPYLLVGGAIYLVLWLYGLHWAPCLPASPPPHG
jgi:hypothetical protein